MPKMLVSTRLVLIACRYLVAAYYQNKWVTVPEIAAFYNISNVRTLLPPLRRLVREGILHSHVGGSTPGFIFAKNPKEITLWDVVVALEGPLSITCCKELIPNIKCDCNSTSSCVVNTLLKGMIDHTIKQYKTISLTELVKSKEIPANNHNEKYE